jgi:hypothetical protein
MLWNAAQDYPGRENARKKCIVRRKGTGKGIYD